MRAATPRHRSVAPTLLDARVNNAHFVMQHAP